MRLCLSQKIAAGLLCSWLLLTAGCSNPSSQSLNSLTVQATPSTVTAGASVTLQATAHLSDGTTQDVTTSTQWTLSNPALATLSNGTLTTKTAGSLSVQGLYVMAAAASASSSTTPAAAQNLTASAQVTINAAPSTGGGTTPTPAAATITWAAPSAVLYGTALSNTQLDATASVPGTFVYTPALGTVLKAGAQTLSVAFTPTDTTTASAATSTVNLTVNQATPTVTWPTIGSIQQGTALSAAQLDATASVAGTFVYSPAAGAVLSTGVQQLTVAFTPTDATDYAAATAKNSISVVAPGAAAAATITWAVPSAIQYGTALSNTQLNATASVPGTFVYTPAAGTVLKVGTQTLSVAFTPTNSSTASPAAATVQLAVNKATPTITWGMLAGIQQGTALGAAQLNATANVPGTFLYSPAAGAVLATGVQQLTAAFTPTDATDYAAVSAKNSVTVTAAASNPPTNPTPPAPTSCGGPTINLNSGMSTSTIQSTISGAADCSVILFGAGTYNITSQINLPCPKTGMTLSGPAVAYPGPYTATLNGSVGGNWGFSYGPCSATVIIEYLNWNGGEPAAGGGGFIYLASATSNLTIQYNFIHGNQASTSDGHDYDSLIWFDGEDSDPPSQYDTNDTIAWNIMGASNDGTPNNADCGAIEPLYTYQGDTYDAIGGQCAAIGVHESTTGLTINNNNIQYQEQGMKFYEGGSSASTFFYQTNQNVVANDISFIHRITLESQQSPTGTNIINNSIHDQANPAWGSWGLSTPEGPSVNCNNNVLIANLTNAGGGAGPGSTEFWGGGTCNNNLVQGYWGAAMQFGFGQPGWTMNNNIIQHPVNNSYINSEEGIPSAGYPTMTGNITSQTLSAVTSAAPAISPSPTGVYSGSVSVTLTDTGVTNGGVGPQGNTTIYYTTDGSTPTTSSTPCNPTPGSTSCSISVSAGATVKAIGMWGSINQPKSYPTGYGFVPSAVVTASYKSSVVKPASKVTPAITPQTSTNGVAALTLTAVAIVPSKAAVNIGGTTQLKALASFSDGSTKDVTTEFGWTSSDLRTMAVSGSGLLSGLATGKAQLSGSYQGYQASVSASSSMGEVDWSAGIVITHGGTYSGNWQSTDARTPAVTIATEEPVIIQDSHISSASDLIKVEVKSADVTVRNSLGVALNASVKGQPNGVFLDATSPRRLVVENDYLENVRDGVSVHGYSGDRSEQQTLVVRGNRVRNLNGLLSDGAGGYLPGQGANRSLSRFVEIDNVQSVPGIDVGWNEVVDYPAQSLVSDVINLYRSSGTVNQPLQVHDTYIQDTYLGGGIKTDGAADDTAQNASAYTDVHDNQVVGTVSYGIAFNAGHDNIAANNRVISSGLLADGTKIAAQQVGLSNADVHGSTAYNNTMRDNVVGWTCWSSSCAAQFLPASPGDYSTNAVVSAKQITFGMEQGEYLLWLNKTTSAGVKVGPTF
jgi:hypothetical protein